MITHSPFYPTSLTLPLAAELKRCEGEIVNAWHQLFVQSLPLCERQHVVNNEAGVRQTLQVMTEWVGGFETDQTLRRALVQKGVKKMHKEPRGETPSLLFAIKKYHWLRQAIFEVLPAQWNQHSLAQKAIHNFIDQSVEAVTEIYTESQKEEEAAASQFQDIADAMPQIVWTGRPDGNLDYYSQKFYDYTGLRPEEARGWGWEQAVHPDDRQECIDVWSKAYRTGGIYEVEFRLRRASDGAYRWHLGRAIPVRNEQGEITKWFGTSTDIDDQRRARDLIQKTSEEFRLITETIPQGVWRSDPDGSADYFSQQFAEYVGYEAKEFLGWGWLDPVHPEDKSAVLGEWKRCSEMAIPVAFEFRLRGTDGVYRWFLSEGNPFRNEKGDVVKYYGTWTNIDDKKKAAEELLEAKKTAESSSRAKSAFLANMSHEIRTPLGAIIGFVDLMKSPELSRGELSDYLRVVHRNADQLLRIVDDILDLSKVEAGKMLIETVEFSLPELLSDITALMSFRAHEKGIHFELKTLSLLPEKVFSDPTRIRQILTNVVGNAIKFTERGQVGLHIRYVDGFLEFVVMDTGIGIGSDEQQKLFRPFNQADASTTRRFGGTGLGLILTRRLSEALGGEFFLKGSEPGKGSEFVARVRAIKTQGVPLVGERDIEVATKLSPSIVEPRGRVDGMKVLLVEDSRDNQVLIKLYLEMIGAKTEIAENGEEGVSQALKRSFDLILMDIQMPQVDGHEATRRLRRSGFKGPIVALTAHAMKEEKRRCIESGFSDFLSKPIHRQSLIEMLHKYH